MAERTSRPPLWLLPKPKSDLPAVVEGKPFAAYALALIALVAVVPALLFLAPDSRWTPQELFAVLVVFAFISVASRVRLRGDLTLDAEYVVLLLCLVFLGPLPAAVIGAVTQISRWLELRLAVIYLLANLVAFTWAPLAGAWVLEALSVSLPFEGGGGGAYGAIAIAGVVVICVNYLLGRTVVGVLHDGLRLPSLVKQEFIPTAPVTGGLILAGVLTAFLYVELGIAGLAPLLLIPLLPRLLTPVLLPARPVSELDRGQATALYAEAIADVLRLERRTKRIIRDATTHLGGSASLSRLDDFPDVMRTVLYCRERWDREGGFPGVVGGEDIPLESRVLAVAEAWSAKTAKGTRELTPGQAVAELSAEAGDQFDPRVVAAAVSAVEDEILPLAGSADLGDRGDRLRNVALRA